nr:MAG TPA: hypothetical protein [Caudoviricetes sp.]
MNILKMNLWTMPPTLLENRLVVSSTSLDVFQFSFW